jgi:1-acyl-sn-glycerol-3-phosphate acyltransferase
MADYVYPQLIAIGKVVFRALDLRVHVEGGEHLPRHGGAVLVSNHVSYLDFLFLGFAALPTKRYTRFMAKEEIFRHRFSGPIMRGCHHIPVDRSAGAGSYKAAVSALRSGEIVGVFAESTISRSFTVKTLKSGAARMAGAAGVPLVPMVTWGGQRLWTKGRPRKLLQRHVPVTILVGEAMYPKADDDPLEVTAELHTRMSQLLDRAQQEYPDKPDGPEDSWWLPAHMGGSAPTRAEADVLDARRE